MNYNDKEVKMHMQLNDYQAPTGFRSSYKGVPFGRYAEVLPSIDFTKYYVMFRGPRPNLGQSSTRKRDAKAFDIYQFSDRDCRENRLEREAFVRGVEWERNR